MAAVGKKHTKTSKRVVKSPKFKAKTKTVSKIKGPKHNARAVPKKTAPAVHHGHLNSMWRNHLLGDATVRSWLIRSVGENSIHVIREFETQMSDEEIAQKSGIRASEVRVVLNKLHSFGLATYVRNRDRNSGWYSYIWKLNNEHIPQVLEQIKVEGAEGTIVADVPDDGKEHYGCSACGPAKRFDFDQASGLQFRCDQCGQTLQFLEHK